MKVSAEHAVTFEDLPPPEDRGLREVEGSDEPPLATPWEVFLVALRRLRTPDAHLGQVAVAVEVEDGSPDVHRSGLPEHFDGPGESSRQEVVVRVDVGDDLAAGP